MEDPERVLGIMAVIFIVLGGAPILSPRLAAGYVNRSLRGRMTAKALGEERAIRLIRFGICPVMVIAGLASGAYAIALATGHA